MLPYRVVLTGGIGSGKSYVADIFRHINIPVFESDMEAKKLYLEKETIDFVCQSIDKDVVNEMGGIDFVKLAKVIFSDKEKLGKLNGYIHPRVMEKYANWSDAQNSPYTINESAIVFESNLESYFDCIVTVMADVEVRIERVMKRVGATDKRDVRERINNQCDDSYRLSHSDFIITNDEAQLLVPQIIKINKKIIENLSSK